MRDKVAEALLSIEDSWNDHEWEQLPQGTQDMFRAQADAAIAVVIEECAKAALSVKCDQGTKWAHAKEIEKTIRALHPHTARR